MPARGMPRAAPLAGQKRRPRPLRLAECSRPTSTTRLHASVRRPVATRKKRAKDADAEADVALLQSVAASPKPSRRRAEKTLAILSRKRSLYSTGRLIDAARERGHRPIVMDTLRCNL